MNQKQTRAAITKAIAFTHSYLSKETAVPTRALEKHFGNAARPLGQYLRNTLLTVTNHHYSKDGKQCKKYIANKEGLSLLMQQYNLSPNALEAYTIDAYWPEITSGMFRYHLQSNRLWHPLQNIHRELRDRMFKEAGYTYKYDIKTAAPSLMTQLANKVSYHYTESIHDYLRKPKEHRQRLANLLNISYDLSKEIITALFNGAQLSNAYTSIGKLLTNEQLALLKQDKFVTALRDEIKTIKKTLSIGGDTKKLWDTYFETELTVMDTALASHSGKVFRVHDGLYTDTPLNTAICTRDCKTKLDLWVEFAHD